MCYDSFHLQFLGKVLGESLFREKERRHVTRSILLGNVLGGLWASRLKKKCKERSPYLYND